MTADEHVPLVILIIEEEMEPMDETDESELDERVERHLRVLDALYHNAGIVASEDQSPPTSEERTEEAALSAFFQELIDGG
jgi:hypothetical protein